MPLIIPKCNADATTLDLTLKVYYEAKEDNGWVENATLIDKLASSLMDAGIEDEKKEPQSYTKKTQVLSYYGLIEWEDAANKQSKRRITANGRKLYEFRQNNDIEHLQELLLNILHTNTFGRNVLGCDSDSDLEAPNIFIKSCLLIKDLTNKEFGYILGRMELDHMEFADVLSEVVLKRASGIKIEPDDASRKWSDPKPILALADWGLFTVSSQDRNVKIYNIPSSVIDKYSDLLLSLRTKNIDVHHQMNAKKSYDENTYLQLSNIYTPYITAIKSKPFILLAGISGTGKSRIVREFAFKSCPKCLQDKDETTPGNYCMIEVKPNWHDSTELLGYYSNLNRCYQFKKFIKFLVKAKMYPEVPFFVCLDEMNLAPVEQYFAEILSILETRKHPKHGESDQADTTIIKSGVIVDPIHFQELSQKKDIQNNQTEESDHLRLTDKDIYLKLFGLDKENSIDPNIGDKYDLTTEGLTLPGNVIIVGTVNMDDTTHQFSRKVIDRAMTIEMNGGRLVDMYGGSRDLEYIEDEEEQRKWQHSFSQHYVTADEVLEKYPKFAERLKIELPARLEAINQALKGTPFEVSYRVLNELTIMVGVMLDDNNENYTLHDIINHAVNNILLMKILPRIEGDAEMFELSPKYKNKFDIQYDNRLEWLKDLAPNIYDETTEQSSQVEDDDNFEPEQLNHPQTAKEKIQEMIDRLDNQEFTRFWP